MTKREIERKQAGCEFWFWSEVERYCMKWFRNPSQSYEQHQGHLMAAFEAQANAIGWASK